MSLGIAFLIGVAMVVGLVWRIAFGSSGTITTPTTTPWWVKYAIGVAVIGVAVAIATTYFDPTVAHNAVAGWTVDMMILTVLVMLSFGALVYSVVTLNQTVVAKGIAILAVVAFVGVAGIETLRSHFYWAIGVDGYKSSASESLDHDDESPAPAMCDEPRELIVKSSEWTSPVTLPSSFCNGVLTYAIDMNGGAIEVMSNDDPSTIREVENTTEDYREDFPVISVQFRLIDGPPTYVAVGTTEALSKLRKKFSQLTQ